MRVIAFFLFLFAGTTLVAQTNTKTISKKADSLYSKILNETRYISVHVPDSAAGNSAGNRYPVIYLLDGEAHFNNVIEILARLKKETGNINFSKTIVVSIGNIWERDRDYTPTHIDSSPMMEDGIAKTTGGAEKFISFMEKELIPYVDSKYPASSFRILIGHSFGGLTVIYTLLNHVKLFNQYIALDPSMWWDEQKLVKQADSLLSNKTFKDNSLFIAVANTWNKEMNDVNQLKNDKTERTALTRPELTLIDHILANKQNKLRFEWKYYQKHNHMSVPPSGIYDGLKFLFKP